MTVSGQVIISKCRTSYCQNINKLLLNYDMNMPVYILLVPVVAAIIGGIIGGRAYKNYNNRKKEKQK